MSEEKETINEEEVKKSKKTLLIAIAVVALCLIVGTAAFIFSSMQKIKAVMAEEGIYQGVTVGGIDVGGLSEEDALALLQREKEEKQELVLYFGNEEWSVTLDDIGGSYDLEDAVETAYDVGRSGSSNMENYRAVFGLIRKGLDIPLEFSYSNTKLNERLTAISEEFNQEAQDSAMERKNGRFSISKEVQGRSMDVSAAVNAVTALLDEDSFGRIEIVAEVTEPKVTYEQNEQVTDLIGSFSTKYTAYDKNRNTNLVVGCDYLNGTIIAPGDTFSATEGLGEQTYARGYRNAGVYVNGKVEAGMGGGVCQITTTLYNAAIMAELEIVERHPHSMTVGYVPLGRDAAIADYYKDLKIKNDTEYPVYLEAYAENGVLQVNLYGHEIHEAGREVSFETVYEATIAKPAEVITEDPERPEGEREVTSTGRTGAKVSVYKIVTQNGTEISREWFSSSSYRSTADEVTVGTKKAEEAQTDVPTGTVISGGNGVSTTDDEFGIQ